MRTRIQEWPLSIVLSLQTRFSVRHAGSQEWAIWGEINLGLGLGLVICPSFPNDSVLGSRVKVGFVSVVDVSSI